MKDEIVRLKQLIIDYGILEKGVSSYASTDGEKSTMVSKDEYNFGAVSLRQRTVNKSKTR
jgi:hypothetical protein